MKTMKRCFVLLLASVMLLSCVLLPVSAAEHPFTDVPDTSWYSGYVQYVYDNGLMNGTSATTFSPEKKMDRAMLVTVLHRMDGSKKTAGETPFTDVKTDSYYYDALLWAYEGQIINGTSSTTFSPHMPISREMMVTIFYRYAQYIGRDVSKQEKLDGYTDSENISGYAETPLMWAVANGIITGTTSDTLSPKGTATRAQCAAVIQRFMEWAKAETEPGEHTHSYTSEVKTEATCTEEGELVFTCSLCGDTYSETIPAKGHDHKLSDTKEATCTEDGLNTYTCSCGDSYTEVIKASGHDYKLSASKEPTCTEDGYEIYTCSCGDSYTETTVATGHDYTSKVTKNATCTEDGVRTYTCSCGDSYTETIKATGHGYTLSGTKEATCTQDGYKTYKCGKCGDSYKETIKATGHSYKLTDSKSATCTADGYKKYKCNNCGDTYSETIKATGHSYTVTGSKPATCTEDGYTKYTCSKCGNSYTETVKGSHDWEHKHTEEVGHWEGWYVCHCGGWEFNAANGNPGPSFAEHARSTGEAEKHSYYGENRWIVDTPAQDSWVCRVCGTVSATKPQGFVGFVVAVLMF